ncbi:Sn1-specific diacylglycerol lipase alpha [Nymphon striatum]|nr:Sn1-specific diacylglycerol lipase alpha [Nymphon striatum]
MSARCLRDIWNKSTLKAMQQYRDSWNKRCRILFCCMSNSDQERNSFTEIAKLLSEFFRDLDVVPSDVVAGLVLLRKYQKLEREITLEQNVVRDFKAVIHHMRYAVAAYGWPMYMMMHPFQPYVQLAVISGECCCLPVRKSHTRDSEAIVHDNCCNCNYAALQRICCNYDMDIIFGTYHVEIGETPFFVCVDHEMKNVVVSIRGTLSLQDVLTDLNAEAEPIPTEPVQDSWYGHKGMVQAAEYIRRKLIGDQLLARAFHHSIERGSMDYQLVLVGHSLGAGTAAILAILLRNEYPTLHCYSFSPPGGLLSLPLAEYTKSFITSVVVGKDLVPRIGLHQMEQLRTEMINSIKTSCDPKWKVIASSVMCCCPDTSTDPIWNNMNILHNRDASTHPSDSSIALTVHQPLYPPGRIIHIVRNHPVQKIGAWHHRSEPIYQALWADTKDFDQVLISPVMIQDHMPDKVLEALEKVLINTGPPKPRRQFSSSANNILMGHLNSDPGIQPSPDPSPSGRLIFETSFTDLNQEASIDIQPEVRYGRNNGTPFTLASQKRTYLPLSTNYMEKRDIFAPLASPETMSDISSLSSYRSSARSSCETSDICSSIDFKGDDDRSPRNSSSYRNRNSDCSDLDVVEEMPLAASTHLNAEVMIEAEPKVSSDVTDSSTSCDQDSSISDSKPNSILKLSKSEKKRVTFDLGLASVHSIPDPNAFYPNYPTYSTQSEYGKHVYDYNGSLDFSQSPPPPPIPIESTRFNNHCSKPDNGISSADFLKMEMPPVLHKSNEDFNSIPACGNRQNNNALETDADLESIKILPPTSFS